MAYTSDRDEMRHLNCLHHNVPEMSQTPAVTWMRMSPAASVSGVVNETKKRGAVRTTRLGHFTDI